MNVLSEAVFLSPALLRLPSVVGVLSEAVSGLKSLPGPAPFNRHGECTVRGCTRVELSPAPLRSPGTVNVLSEPVSLSLVLLSSPGVMGVLSEAVTGLTSLPGTAPFNRCRECTVRGCTRVELSPQPRPVHQAP